MCSLKMIQDSWGEYFTGDYEKLVIYTKMIVGRGINGVDQHEYKSGIWCEDNEPMKFYQISNVQFSETYGYITFDYTYRHKKIRRCDFSTKVYLPLSEIISIELIKK